MDEDELTPEQKFAAEGAETMVPRALMLGQKPEEIIKELVRMDYTPAAARTLVDRVANDIRRFQKSPDSRRRLIAEARTQWLSGCAAAFIGVLISAFTLIAAIGGALPFVVVSIGFVLVGLVIAGRGWGRWRYYRRLRPPAQADDDVSEE